MVYRVLEGFMGFGVWGFYRLRDIRFCQLGAMSLLSGRSRVVLGNCVGLRRSERLDVLWKERHIYPIIMAVSVFFCVVPR